MIRADIKPELLIWARERAGREVDALSHRFPKITDWEQGTVRPTLKQVEDFAKATHTPVGFLFLEDPPVETIPRNHTKWARNDVSCGFVDRLNSHEGYFLAGNCSDKCRFSESMKFDLIAVFHRTVAQ